MSRLISVVKLPRQFTFAGMAGLLMALVSLIVVPGIAHAWAQAQAPGGDSEPDAPSQPIRADDRRAGLRTLREPAIVLPDHGNAVAVGFANDGTELVSASATIRRWDVDARRLTSEIRLVGYKPVRPVSSFNSSTLRLSGDCRRVAALTEDYVGIWDTATGELLKTLSFPKELQVETKDVLACTPDLSVIACGLGCHLEPIMHDANTVVWDVASGKVLQTVKHPGAFHLPSIALSPDGKRLATCSGSHTCTWETSTGKLLHSLRTDKSVWSLQFSPSGKQLAIGDRLGVKLVDARSGAVLYHVKAPFRHGSRSLAFSKDGRLLARMGTRAETDGIVRILSTQTGEMLVELPTAARDGSFSDDGRWFAVGFSDRKTGLAVWRLSGSAVDADKDAPAAKSRAAKDAPPAAPATELKPKRESARALFRNWQENARTDGKIPGGAIGSLAATVAYFIEHNPTGERAPKFTELLERIDTSRDWTQAEAVALLDDVTAIYETLPGWVGLHRRPCIYSPIRSGKPLPEELSGAAWGQPAENGLHAAWLLEPVRDAYPLGTALKSRILFHNTGKKTVIFPTEVWHQPGHKARNSTGAVITVSAELLEIVPLPWAITIRLAPGEYAEVGAHGIAIGARSDEDNSARVSAGAWIEAKEGDEVTFQPSSVVASDGATAAELWKAIVEERIGREAPLPAAAADREQLIRRVTFDLIGVLPTHEEIAAFTADKSPDALAALGKRLLPRVAPFAGNLPTGEIKFRVTAANPDSARTDNKQAGVGMMREPAFLLPDDWIVMSVGFDNDSTELVTASAYRFAAIRRWDVAGKKLKSEIKLTSDKPGRYFDKSSLRLSEDRRRVIALTDEYVGIWDTATGKLLKTLSFPNDEARGHLACTPDLSVIACGKSEGASAPLVPEAHAIIWDVASGKVLQTVTHPGVFECHSIALSPDGKWLATGGEEEAHIRIWETSTGKLLREIPNDKDGRNLIWNLQFSPSGKQLAIGGGLGVKLWDVESGELLHRIEAPYSYSYEDSRFVFSKDGRLLARTGASTETERDPWNRRVPIWSTQTGKMLFELRTDSRCGSFSDDGQRFVVGFPDPKMGLAVWQLSGSAVDAQQADEPVPESSNLTVPEIGHYYGKKAAALIDLLKPAWGDERLGIQYGVALNSPQRQFRIGQRVPLAVFFRNVSGKQLSFGVSPDFFWGNIPKVVNAKGVAVEIEKVALLGRFPRYGSRLEPGEALGPLHLSVGLGENSPPGKQNWHPYYKTPVAGKYTLTHSLSVEVGGSEAGKDVTSGTIEFEIVDDGEP